MDNGVQYHRLIGVGEIYDHIIRTSYRKQKISYTQIKWEILLSIRVKIMNETLFTEEIIPSAINFGELIYAASCIIPRPLQQSQLHSIQDPKRS